MSNTKSMSLKELKECDFWVNWCKEITDKGKETKIPYVSEKPYLQDGENRKRRAKSNDNTTWRLYSEAEKHREHFDGIGVMFGSGLCGIDIDGLAEHTEENPIEKEIFEMFKDTYVEKSPSGKGIHILFFCDVSKLPENYKDIYSMKNTKNKVECYFSGITNRYFTFTGNKISENDIIIDKTDTVLEFLDKYMKKPVQESKSSEREYKAPEIMNADKIIEIIERSEQASKFSELFHNGSAYAYNDDKSSGDMALCDIIAYYTHDYSVIEEIVNRSALGTRDKWVKREDYRRRTIEKAINTVPCGYNSEYRSGSSYSLSIKNGSSLSDQSQSSGTATENNNTVNEDTEYIKTAIEHLNSIEDYIEKCSAFREYSKILDEKTNGEELKKIIIDTCESASNDTRPLTEYPETFDKTIISAPFTPNTCLPPVLAEYLEEQAKAIQIKPSMLALPCISVLAACVQGKYKVSVRKGGYSHELPIYAFTISPPSERKTASINAFLKPVIAWTIKENEKIEKAREEAAINIKVIKAGISKFERSTKGSEIEYRANLKALEEANKNMPKKLPQHLTNATTEAVIKQMSEHGKVFIASDECGTFDVLAGLHNNGESDIDILLNGYDGSLVNKVRVSGDNAIIPRALLTICVMAQPSKFNDIINKKSLSGRGLMERFLFSFPEKYGVHVDDTQAHIVDKEIESRYIKAVHKLLNLKAPESEEVPTLTLNKKAELLYKDYHNKIEREIQSGIFSKGEFAQQYGGKHVSKMLRIAAILHLCEHSPEEEINEQTLLYATRFSDWSIEQARRVFDESATTSPEEARMKELLKKLCKKFEKGKPFTIRDTDSFTRRMYSNNFKLREQDIDDLHNRRFIQLQNKKEVEANGRKAKIYKINPFTYDIIKEF